MSIIEEFARIHPHQRPDATARRAARPWVRQVSLALALFSCPILACSDGSGGVQQPQVTPTAPPTETTADVPPVTTPPPVAPGGQQLEDQIIDDTPPAPQGPGGIRPSEKIDLLFVVDNSSSMADKQAIFKRTIPDLIDYLVNPPCLDATTELFVPLDEAGHCPAGSTRIFQPVTDIHIGLISSSLGPRGAQGDEIPEGCGDAPPGNDRAHLLGLMRPSVTASTYQEMGFLVWDPQQKANPPGEADLQTLISNFEAQVDAVGERGCGFEAPLEAAYRFLIEPKPYEGIERVPCSEDSEQLLCAREVGIDQALLDQRAAFLRPDSVVVVMFLTDENDCSLRTRQGFHVLRPEQRLGNATNSCETDPNDPCCQSCNAPLKDGCPALEESGCNEPLVDTYEAYNVRCYDQERRFGLKLLRDPKFYGAGFKNTLVADRDNPDMGIANPLITEERGREKVFVVGIIGVPWQDTATPETVDDPNDLRLRRSFDWSLFLPQDGQPPADPFNIESMEPRQGTHPLTEATLGGPDTWNPINGHDRPITSGDGLVDDLQYACIFPLEAPRDCTTSESYCDCVVEVGPEGEELDYATGNPLCRDPESGEYGTVQHFAKAYPAPRILQTLQEVGDQGLVASICPRQTDDASKPDFGYRPVIRALLLNAARVLPK